MSPITTVSTTSHMTCCNTRRHVVALRLAMQCIIVLMLVCLQAVSGQYSNGLLGFSTFGNQNVGSLGLGDSAIASSPSLVVNNVGGQPIVTPANYQPSVVTSYEAPKKRQRPTKHVVVIEQQYDYPAPEYHSEPPKHHHSKHHEIHERDVGEQEDNTEQESSEDNGEDNQAADEASEAQQSELESVEENRPSSKSGRVSTAGVATEQTTPHGLPPGASGLYVATSERNYAIVSPDFESIGWLSASVNDDQVFILSLNKQFQSGSLQSLDPAKRDFLEKLAGEFVRNTQGLQLNDGFNANGEYYPAPASTSDTSSHSSDFVRSANNGLSHHKTSSSSIASSSLSTSSSLEQSSSTSGSNSLPSGLYGAPVQKPAWCTKNHYVNLYNSNLNKTLQGDVYYFDSYGNQLNLYSTTVNTFCRDQMSIVFRDENYFCYSRVSLPYGWNRFFVQGTNVFIIYNDGSVLVKPIWALESNEFNAILRARTEVKQLVNSQQHQAKVNAKEFADPKLADIVSVVKSVLSSVPGQGVLSSSVEDILT